ncbi:MAG: hypothetical protein MZV64_13610 [Ignavibacteriales bacterium]|nr:hypothetical protein [Ignavibacteriales bacterium]
MPTPITFDTTMAAASIGPRRRSSCCGLGGWLWHAGIITGGSQRFCVHGRRLADGGIDDARRPARPAGTRSRTRSGTRAWRWWPSRSRRAA